MTKYKSDDHLKVESRDDRIGEHEWMWVCVDSCDDEKQIVFGQLDSVPVLDYDKKLKLGSKLAVSYGNVREHRTALEFNVH